MMKKYSVLILAVSFLIYGCEDKNKIAQAQACLDSISQSNYQAAEGCLQYVADDSSQQADIIRCSGYMMAGGLTTNKMVNAYKALSGSSNSGTVTNKEAVFIGTLVLDSSTLANKGDTYCKKSGVTGLMYISGLAVMGTMIAEVGASIGTYNNPPTEAEVNAVINDCTGGTPNAACNPTVIGNVANTIASTYCANQSADQSVCNQVNSAIATSGSDTAKVGNALLCLLKKGTYDPNSDTCT